MRARPRHPPSRMNTWERTSVSRPRRFALSPDDFLSGVRLCIGPDRFIDSPILSQPSRLGSSCRGLCLSLFSPTRVGSSLTERPAPFRQGEKATKEFQKNYESQV